MSARAVADADQAAAELAREVNGLIKDLRQAVTEARAERLALERQAAADLAPAVADQAAPAVAAYLESPAARALIALHVRQLIGEAIAADYAEAVAAAYDELDEHLHDLTVIWRERIDRDIAAAVVQLTGIAARARGDARRAVRAQAVRRAS